MRQLIVFLALLLASDASRAEFSVSRFKVAGGGGNSSGGDWRLAGTIGQTDADVVPLCSLDGSVPGLCAGASYRLVGGFWSGLRRGAHPSCGAIPDCIFRDGFEAADQ